MIKIKKNDSIIVISGKDRGKRGKVLRVFQKSNRIVVEGIALVRRHRKPQKAGKKGEIVSLPSSIDVSSALVFCERCKRGARAGYQLSDTGIKTRICKKCKNEL